MRSRWWSTPDVPSGPVPTRPRASAWSCSSVSSREASLTSAAKLGFEPVTALDNDAAAVEAALANAAANGVELDVRCSDVVVDPLPSCEVAVANIARDTVERVAMRFAGSLVVASGYLEQERPEPRGWTAVDRRLAEGWAADVLVREES